jgi:hypothetical protein
MSGAINSRLWEPQALSGLEWSETRTLALAALSALTSERT